MKLLILAMSNDGIVEYRVDDKYQYECRIDTAHYPFIKKNMYRKPGQVINLLKTLGEVERVNAPTKES